MPLYETFSCALCHFLRPYTQNALNQSLYQHMQRRRTFRMAPSQDENRRPRGLAGRSFLGEKYSGRVHPSCRLPVPIPATRASSCVARPGPAHQTMFAIPPFAKEMDVEVLVLTVAAVCVGLVVLLDFFSKTLKPKTTLTDPSTKVALVLTERTELSHDTHLFRFALPTKEHVLGLPVGQHVQLSYTDQDGAEQGRPYTPTSSDHDVGHVDFVIKVYFPCEKFPEGGKVSQHMHSLRVGDTLDFSGPKGRYEYRGKGLFAIKKLKSQGGGFEVRKAKHVGMIAGGSGITPMQQISAEMLRDKNDKTKISLLFANQTEKDILLRETLDAAAVKNGDKFSVHYTVDKAPNEKWKFSEGFITPEMIKKHMPPPGKHTQILLCGPPPMIKFAVMPAFEKLGYTKEMFMQW
jgi:cytochrome-b5 reductase